MRLAAAGHGLRSLANCGGCAAKVPAETLALLTRAAAGSTESQDALLVGLDPADDAAVYAIDDAKAMIATVDFFPPIVDDPADYGAIAAANAVSDVYAMGGDVAFALVLSGFPSSVPAEQVALVTQAAGSVVRECGGVIAGGHSIRCAEPVFGLSVTGFVDPNRIWRKRGALVGDVLMLSKPLGTGLLIGAGDKAMVASAIEIMRATNASAARSLKGTSRAPSAVTDVTGFGLAGHAWEMAAQSKVALSLEVSAIPLLEGTAAVAAQGFRTSAHASNFSQVSPHLRADLDDEAALAPLFDPQTSGGLLAAVDPQSVASLQAQGFVRVGDVLSGEPRISLA